MEYDRDEIRAKVIRAPAKCLARNPEEIKGPDTLIHDLGLDSLDFLDLMFALEKAFQVKIRDEDFDRLLKPTQNEALPPHLSAEEVRAMSRFIPDLDQKAREGAVPRNSVLSMMTTETLVNMIAFKLNQQGR
jgi:acyl carrier protein